mmetsp:Transcript_22222/g.56056  ORF Transcript_22222/g.56056 Transcript_22222/m.56056 type:complete len:172 (-) Transcript_22222:1486-2001(-)
MDPPVVFDLVSSGDGWIKPTAADVVLLTVDIGDDTKVIEYDLRAENAVQSVAGKGVGARFAAAFTQEEPLDANSILFGVASTPFGSLLSSHLQKCVVGDAFRISCDSASASGGSDGGPAVGSSRVVVQNLFCMSSFHRFSPEGNDNNPTCMSISVGDARGGFVFPLARNTP